MMEALQARIAACGNLAEVILVGLKERPPWVVVDVIVQDEFTHDVIVAAEGSAPDDPALVLDCT